MVSLVSEGGSVGIFLWVSTSVRTLPVGHQKKAHSLWTRNNINRGHQIKVPGRGTQFESDHCSIALDVRRLVRRYLLQSPLECCEDPGRTDMPSGIGEATEG